MARTGREVERKFLVEDDAWRERARGEGEEITQGYLHVGDDGEVRVRVRGGAATLTIKRGGHELDRTEVEVPLDLDAAQTLLDAAVVGDVLRKRRFEAPLPAGRDGSSLVAEVDEFGPPHDGLVLAEVELPDESTPVPDVPWLGTEVTGDKRFYNASLATHDESHEP